MRSLFIDTSTSNLIVSIVNEGKIIRCFNETTSNDLSTTVFPVIEDLFKSVQMVPDDIDTIFVVNGPGSFTGVRIGVTIAKTFAWALNKKVIPISSLEVIASGNRGKAVALIDARRNAVFAGGYDEESGAFLEDQYIKIDELLKLLPNGIELISYDIFSDLTVSKPEVDILKVINAHKDDSGVNPHQLIPNYLKLTEAEEKFGKNE